LAKSLSEVGYRFGMTAFAFAVAYDVVQILQVVGLLGFPFDEILIYGTSLGIVAPFVLAVLAFHHLTPRDKQFWSHGALVFAIVYAVFVIANYVVQLATVVPAKMRGDAPGLLEQTPHSLFWTYDAIGYISMGIAMLLALPALRKAGIEKWARWALLANVCVTPMISVVYFYPTYSTRLLFLGFPWAVTAPLAMLMLAKTIRSRTVEQQHLNDRAAVV
jgi:hypothetical protein